jgi:hypothetical protein
MPKKGKSFDDILSDAERLIRVWTENPKLSLGDVTRESFQAQVSGFKSNRAINEELRMQLTRGINEVNDEAGEIQSINTRALSGARAQFGQDSSQYEQLGGTRASERKPPKKKTPKS